MQSLLDLLDKTESELRQRFVCPRLGIELEARLPPAHEVAAARAAAAREYAEQRGQDADPQNAVEDSALGLLALRHLVARAVFHEGQPVGMEPVARLDENTLKVWASHVDGLERRICPPLETWTAEQIERFVEGLKKKDPRCVDSLMLFDGATLIGFTVYMAGLLASSETSSSSTGSR